MLLFIIARVVISYLMRRCSVIYIISAPAKVSTSRTVNNGLKCNLSNFKRYIRYCPIATRISPSSFCPAAKNKLSYFSRVILFYFDGSWLEFKRAHFRINKRLTWPLNIYVYVFTHSLKTNSGTSTDEAVAPPLKHRCEAEVSIVQCITKTK